MRYGQALSAFSTTAAPHPFTCNLTSYTEREYKRRQLFSGEDGAFFELAQTALKTDLNWEGDVTDGSTDFIDLSTGAYIPVDGFDTGVVLCSRATERWALGQDKTVGAQATHYPDLVQATPTAATTLSAFTPAAQALAFLLPGAKVIYGTAGLTHAAGTVHGLTLEQQWTLTEDDESPDGKILGVDANGYMKTISLEILAKSTKPVPGAVLTVTGAPAHAANFRIESAGKGYTKLRGMMYPCTAVWIPPFT